MENTKKLALCTAAAAVSITWVAGHLWLWSYLANNPWRQFIGFIVTAWFIPGFGTAIYFDLKEKRGE